MDPDSELTVYTPSSSPSPLQQNTNMRWDMPNPFLDAASDTTEALEGKIITPRGPLPPLSFEFQPQRVYPALVFLPADAPQIRLHSMIPSIRSMKKKDAMQVLWSGHIPVLGMHALWVQFALGGVPDCDFTELLSPAAIFRSWRRDSGEEKPSWVGGKIFSREVDAEFAAGRCMVMSARIENAAISRDLHVWAQKFYDGDLDKLATVDMEVLQQPTEEDHLEYEHAF